MIELPSAPGISHQICPINGMTFTLSLPQGYQPGTPAPLIIALHWSGPISPYFGEGILASLVEPALRELGAIIAAPDCRFPNWSNLRVENQVLDLVDYLASGYGLSAHRTVLTGYSLGGTGTWFMAARRAGRFCAAIPMACAPHPDIHLLNWRVPTYAIHSINDEVVGYEQVVYTVRKLKQRGVPVELKLLDDPGHYDTGGYIEALRLSQGWLKQRWEASKPGEEG